MRNGVGLCLVVACLAVLTPPGLAQWTNVGPGIDYQKFTLPDPNNVFVARMDRSHTGVTLESSIANGTAKGARETVRNQAARYDDAINWWGQSWGQRNDVIVAINGDFFNTTTGVITGGQVQDGWYALRFGDWGGYSGFGWTVNRVPFIGGCVYHQPANQVVAFPAVGRSQQINGINRTRGSNELIVYTPQYDATTGTDSSGSEVLVEMTQPSLILKAPNKSIGYVRQIRQNLGSTPIPFDHVVLSATGSAATSLLTNVSIGAEVDISQFPTDYNEPDTSGNNGCAYATGLDWQRTYTAIGVNYRFLEAGQVRPPDPNRPGYAGLIVRNPRTAIAYDNYYIYFVVCDGRTTSSVGMTMVEIGNFCVNYLGATEGVNLDGGGSSTMVVNGVVKNHPSDGSERAVANGMMMVAVQPKIQSAHLQAGQSIKTRGTTSVRLGPGTNYAVIQSVPVNTQGTVLPHGINGVYAKGAYWWKCSLGSATGWVDETMILPPEPPPVITAISPTLGGTVLSGIGVPCEVAITFSRDVVVNSGHLVLTSPVWGAQTPTAFIYDAGARRATWTFVGLRPDTYTGTLSEAVRDTGNRALDGEIADPADPASLPSGDGQEGGDAVFSFRVRFRYGDFDTDGDVDLGDFSVFQYCFRGPNRPPESPECARADADGDNDVDLTDFAIF
ncbi:MAG: phosphodiester glycosidase family protein, partial [Phycisphaerae bacterium]